MLQSFLQQNVYQGKEPTVEVMFMYFLHMHEMFLEQLTLKHNYLLSTLYKCVYYSSAPLSSAVRSPAPLPLTGLHLHSRSSSAQAVSL